MSRQLSFITCWAYNLKVILPWEILLAWRHRVREVTLALVLSYHKINGFLSIVEVELVVLLLVDIFAIVIDVFTIQIWGDFGAILAWGTIPWTA